MKPQQFWLRWALAALLLSLVVGFLVPPRIVQPLVGVRAADSWALPPLPRWRLAVSTPALIAGAPMWGSSNERAEQAADVPAAPEDTRWRLAGVIGAPTARRVLVSFSDAAKPPQLLRVGETLPSGHRIVRIDAREVCVAVGKRRYTLGLEPLEVSP